jgi:Tfp pilus assembly protein PilF
VTATTARSDRRRRGGRAPWLALGALVLAALAAPLLWPEPADGSPATWVGRATCASCHAAESAAFTGSHHDLAMQPPTAATVLGDFGGSTFTHHGVTTTFTRAGDQFVVRTDGPDGTLRDYRVAWAFGATPLQQYLLDAGSGRLQALTIAWDSRPREQGGQRWFHLYPDEPTPAGDELHWTGIQQNWNFMCAGCHSTNLQRRYDAAGDRYDTTWSEVDVSCEACHGPASRHVAWANGQRGFRHLGGEPGKGLTIALDERRGVTWTHDPGTRLPVRSRARATQTELDLCARCHSRRTEIDDRSPPGRPLLDTHLPALLTEGLYHADGQMQDEVYNYQSFLQSRMSRAGVTCSDCHDPHSGRPRLPGNGVCLQCHEPRFDARDHHFHEPGTPAARCVACHAPTVTYMGVDPRHDHSFRVPRPDLTVQFGVPDACTGCHRDQQAPWAVAKLQQWYGRLRTDRSVWTEAFAAARAHRAGAEDLLLRVARDRDQPGIVRATALHELPPLRGGAAANAVRSAIADADPLLRWAAAEVLGLAADELRAPLQPLLHDPVRAVRMAAARGLRSAGTSGWPAADVAALQAGLAEYEAAQRGSADRPEARMNLGNLELERGNAAAAEAEFRAALHLHPQFVPAFVNLADLYRAGGRESACERTLRDGLRVAPVHADLLHALGLCLVRQKKVADAIPLLAQAAVAAPEEPRHAYVHAVALEAVGRLGEAVAALEAAGARLPGDRDLRELLVEYLLQQGNTARARALAADYAARWPEDAASQRWRNGLLK